MRFDGWSQDDARAFALRWLPAWTGNDPQLLASFYTDDAFYSDPAIPEGVQGKEALVGYFAKLLARYPDWVWVQTRATPIAGGFLNYWHASIPAGEETVECDGVCAVYLRGELIERNEVHFDRASLLQAQTRQARG